MVIPLGRGPRETQLYVRSLERGMTIFDLPAQTAATDLQQWEPILDWLKPLLYPPQAANDSSPSQPMAAIKPSLAKSALASVNKPCLPQASLNRLGSSLPSSLMPAQESLIHGARLSLLGANRPSMAPVRSNSKPALSRNVDLPDGMQIPQFLKRAPH